jgi:hypothetical protein
MMELLEFIKKISLFPNPQPLFPRTLFELFCDNNNENSKFKIINILKVLVFKY